MQQLIIDSSVVSSSIVSSSALPIAPTATRAIEPAYDIERIERMFERKLPVPTAWWEGITYVIFVAFINAPLIEIAIDLQKEFPNLQAFSAWRALHGGYIEIKLNMIQLLRIVGAAKRNRILQ